MYERAFVRGALLGLVAPTALFLVAGPVTPRHKPITDESLGNIVYKAGVEDGGDERRQFVYA